MMNQIETWEIENKFLNIEIKNYLLKLHETLLDRLKLLDEINEAYFSNSFTILMEDNHKLYEELQIDYEKSYANPSYTSQKLSKDIAPICSWLYYEVLMMTPAIFQKDFHKIHRIKQYFLTISVLIQKSNIEIQELIQLQNEMLPEIMKEQIKQNYGEDGFYTKLHEHQDFSDIRYLFRYGVYVSENEVAAAKIMQEMSPTKIWQLAKQMVDGYMSGFISRNKTITSRSHSRIVQIMGLEKIAHQIKLILKEQNQVGMISELVYKGCNPQAVYDHRQDEALFIDEAYMKLKESLYKQSLEAYKEDLSAYLGNIIMVSFGQHKLDTKNNQDGFTYSDKQNEMIKTFELSSKIEFENNVPKKEISFTGMAFPLKEIHEDYEKVFNHIMDINLMDSKHHEEIQELLIQQLDQGEYVKIIGYRGNETNIQVYLQKMENPDQQTNFVNCGADINNPVGEVYTSPELLKTHGLLHIKQARISKIAFHNIRITFEDGFTKDYSCTNFDDEQASHDLMDEVIFHHRSSLPMGEFALGTNTYAYALAKNDDILYKLHTLIFEKLGPHIAIGDTCFAWSEDNKLTSLYSGKEMIAKDNCVSLKRHENIKKAYMGVHYDLTIPYDEIYSLSVHKYDGSEIELVHEGRFVLAGCEYLNEPLDQLL